jgi:hypothetical protein
MRKEVVGSRRTNHPQFHHLTVMFELSALTRWDVLYGRADREKKETRSVRIRNAKVRYYVCVGLQARGCM